MKQLLQLEQLSLLTAAIAGLYLLPLHLSWWAYQLLFFAPDLSIAGYLVNNSMGARLYNLAHHQGLALVAVIAGIFAQQHALTLCGLSFLGHAAFDRVLGYGLKYRDSFHRTHLGWIKKADAGKATV